MKRKPVTLVREVNFLTDPNPSFVSLVNHGANQTPWRVVKHAEIFGDTLETPAKEETTMKTKPKKLVAKKVPASSQTGHIQRLRFSKTQFATEEKVSEWLQKYGWDADSYTISTEKVAFMVVSKEFAEGDLDDIQQTKTKTEGVTAFIGKLADTSDPDEEDDENEDGDDDDDGDSVTKTAETEVEVKPSQTFAPLRKHVAAATLVTKFDWWDAYMADEKDLKETISRGMRDGIPPGFYEVMNAVNFTAAAIFKDDELDKPAKRSAVEKLGSDFASVAMGLYELFEAIEAEADTSAKSAEAVAFAENFNAELTEASKGDVTLRLTLVTSDGEDDPVAEAAVEKNEPVVAAKSEPETKSAPVLSSEDLAKLMAKAAGDAVTAALVPVQQELSELRSTTEEAKQLASKALARKQTPKGSGSGNDAESRVDTSKEDAETKRRAEGKATFKSMMGVN